MSRTTPEAAVTKKVLEWLASKEKEGAPLLWEHRSGGGGYSNKKGRADLWVSANGHHLEIELKALDGKLSSMQEQFMLKCQQRKIPWLAPRSAGEAISFIASFLE